MASNKQIRLQCIIELLERRGDSGASFEEIAEYLVEKFQQRDKELPFSERTFERDKKDLEIERGIKVEYNRAENVYYIAWDEISEAKNTLMESIWMIESIRDNRYKNDFMIFEKRPKRGLNWLNGLIHAIQNKLVVSFDYYKFKEDTTRKRIVEPYALKEFDYHWYLLANERNKEGNFMVKTFALDRISELEIEKTRFKKRAYNPEQVFKHSYGIITKDEKPMEIVLRFDRHQGNYAKVRPWHSSQEIIQDDEKGLITRLYLVPTYDFDQKILSLANRVEVLSPPEYRAKIKMYLNETMERYQED